MTRNDLPTALWMVFFLATSVYGQGQLIVEQPAQPLELRHHQVHSSINDQVATTTVEHVFYNPTSQRLEGHFIFPLPIHAQVDRVSMDVGGVDTEAQLLDAEKARKIYEDIVRRTLDPALLEYAGRGMIRARIFPIEPNSEKRITVTYTHLLPNDNGLIRYDYPLTTRTVEGRTVTRLAMKIELKTSRPLATIYSPSHDMQITRKGHHRAIIGLESHEAGSRDLQLLFAPQSDDDPLAMSLLTYRDDEESDTGYFMLLASPKGLAKSPALPKSIVFVLDSSGSMAGAKLEQAKRALQFCINNLNEKDTFEVVRFSTDVEPVFGELREATPQNIAEAIKFIDSVKAIGGTAIHEALESATAMMAQARTRGVRYVVFLTDGKPTIGQTKSDVIVDSIATDPMPRVFCFGIGTQINTKLLDYIAQRTGGATEYVLPSEDLELKLSSFYTKIDLPALANPTLDILGDITLMQLQPAHLRDLFQGDQLVVFGRYRGTGPATLVLKGQRSETLEVFEHDVIFTHTNRQHTFIAQMWATRRIGWLLDEIRLHGESSELIDEVVHLARRYAILTPYTSYLIVEDEDQRNVPIAQQTLRDVQEVASNRVAAARAYDDMKKANTGSRGVTVSRTNARLRLAGSLAPVAVTAPTATPQEMELAVVLQRSQVVGGRAFVQNGSRWIDTHIQMLEAPHVQQITFGSDDYFALLRKHPKISSWLSIGRNVSFILDDQVIEIVEQAHVQ